MTKISFVETALLNVLLVKLPLFVMNAPKAMLKTMLLKTASARLTNIYKKASFVELFAI
jgi:hypothetical protein